MQISGNLRLLGLMVGILLRFSLLLESSETLNTLAESKQELTAVIHENVAPIPPKPLKIVILTMNRFDSLKRLINSLQNTDYGTDRVDLTIKFDRPPPNHHRSSLGVQLAAFRSNLTWAAGSLTIVPPPTQNRGLRQSWLEAWEPTDDEDRAIIFEDDVEVSPLWYKWLQAAYAANRHRPHLGGIGLQRPVKVPNPRFHQSVPDDNNGLPFLYRNTPTYGFSPMARHWKEFLDFAKCGIDQNMRFRMPWMKRNDYYLRSDPRGIWSLPFMYFTYQRDLYNLYVAPGNETTLAAHWRERGEHHKAKTAARDFQILQDPNHLSFEFPVTPFHRDWEANSAEPTPEKRTLAMGLWNNPGDHQELERYANNLREYYQGDAVLFVPQDHHPRSYDSELLLSVAKSHNIRVVPNKNSADDHSSRLKVFHSECQAYDMCLGVVDVRDVTFQSDPFDGQYPDTCSDTVVMGSPSMFGELPCKDKAVDMAVFQRNDRWYSMNCLPVPIFQRSRIPTASVA